MFQELWSNLPLLHGNGLQENERQEVILQWKVYGPYCKDKWLSYCPERNRSEAPLCMGKGHKTRPVTLRPRGGHLHLPGGPVKTQITRPTSRIPDSVGLEWAREFTFLARTRGCRCCWSRDHALRKAHAPELNVQRKPGLLPQRIRGIDGFLCADVPNTSLFPPKCL